MAIDGFQKFESYENCGARPNAAEANAALPPGNIIPDAARDEMDSSIKGIVEKAGSRCSAVCTSELKADGHGRCANISPNLRAAVYA